MESRKKLINVKGNKNIHMGIIPGHFATNHSHINHYVDLNSIKTSFRMARETAKMIAEKYNTVQIDTIICLEGTETLGAFLAQELADSSVASINSGKDIDSRDERHTTPFRVSPFHNYYDFERKDTTNLEYMQKKV